MAPEICTPPSEQSSYESDVWSYGCIVLEITSGREPWIDQYPDDSSLFRALQRKENAPIFARICADQSGPSQIRQLLMQCCTWTNANRPRFADILNHFGAKYEENTFIDDRTDAMSIDIPIADDDSGFDYKQNIRTQPLEVQDHVDNYRNTYTKPSRYQERLTGEIFISKGTASGRPIYEGVKGGRYYLTASGSKVYLHK
jgi:serine/threonine protein kinase